MPVQTGGPLPQGFNDLLPFLDWGDLHTQAERYLRRQSSPFEALKSFHAAMAPRLDAVYTHLDTFPFGPLPMAEAQLHRMALGLIEAGQAVEIFGQAAVPFAPVPHHVGMTLGQSSQ